MPNAKTHCSWFVGYLGGDAGLVPDVIKHPTHSMRAGEAWGSYVTVEGPFATKQAAQLSAKRSSEHTQMYADEDMFPIGA